jgi:hypothetical protein
MNWLYYLLEANLYLASFYLLYRLLLQNSTFYNSNRYFLVLSVAAAFAIPLIQLGFLKPPMPLAAEVSYEIPLEAFEMATVTKSPVLTAQDYITYCYLAIAILLSLKFIVSITKIINIYLSSKKRKLSNYTLVELSAEHTAFSFFNILFIHPEMAKNDAVLKHEIIHIQQKHSWDIILLELLKICCWFNPVVYLMKKDFTLLHEYIADKETTVANISKHEYALFLIENSMAAYSSSLVNQLFNQSILKSRINMLNKEKTANWARLKYLLALPLGLGLLCVSTLGFSKSYGYDVLPASPHMTKDKPLTQEKKKYYPKYKHDKNGNYISLEERLIVINGNVIKDKNKYYGTAEADKIIYLNSSEAIKKYGADKGKNGAVELYGEKVVNTFPPPVVKKDKVSPPPAIETPPAGKKLKKFPPPIVKPSAKTETINLKEDKAQEIEIVAAPSQKEIIVQGYKTPANKQAIQKVKGINLEEKADPNKEEIVVVGYKTEKDKSTQKVKGINLENKADPNKEEVVVVGYKTEKDKSTQKVKGINLENKADPNKEEVVVVGYKTEKAKPAQKVEGKEIVPTKKVQ